MISNFLLRLARQVVESVLAQLMQQNNVVQNMALAPMRAMVQQVLGGIWRGDGANAFVNEVTQMMIPGVERVSDTITKLNSNVRFAQDTITQADQKVSRLVQSKLTDTFNFF
mgnify:CR=1 FL=1|jgi:Proteins of 100 residues with WXG.